MAKTLGEVTIKSAAKAIGKPNNNTARPQRHGVKTRCVRKICRVLLMAGTVNMALATGGLSAAQDTVSCLKMALKSKAPPGAE
jgi:hypothetical protein